MIMLKWYTPENTFFLSDFDRTESCHGETTPGVFASCPHVPKKLMEARVALYKKYRPIEIDIGITPHIKAKHMKDWHDKSTELIQEYISYDIFQAIQKYSCEVIPLRKSIKQAKFFAQEHWMPWITYSAWFAEIIEAIMDHNDVEHGTVHGNRLGFSDDGLCTGITNQVPIFNDNKVWSNLPVDIQKSVADIPRLILLWDMRHDLKMAPEWKEAESIGFLVSDQITSRRLYEKDFTYVIESDTCDLWILSKIQDKLITT